jgi:deazaflavin-dependent oxidoreductase (nitroreductase family)
VPSNATFKLANAIHRPLFRLSKGRWFGRGLGMPVLVLTTTGRKSGARRSNMLTTPLEIGDSIVLVGSRGGDDRHPDWYFNLEADPAVDVEMAGTLRPMTARVVHGDERADLWARIIAAHDNYEGYQRKTDREIPVVVLDPR